MVMIEPTRDEIDFIRRLEEHGGEIVVEGNIRLLKIGRLIPEYVTQVNGSSEMGRFRLTEMGWQFARKINDDIKSEK